MKLLLPFVLISSVQCYRSSSRSVRGLQGDANVTELDDSPMPLPKEGKHKEKRDCKTRGEKNKVKSTCTARETDEEGTKNKDEIKFEVAPSNRGIEVKIEYKQKVDFDQRQNASLVDTESKTKFSVFFDSIVEYLPAEEGNAYDWGATDSDIQVMDLDDWEPLSDVEDDGTIATFTATSKGREGGDITFDFTISRADVNDQITANTMKIDFNVADWPWMRNDTYVALLSTVETERKIKAKVKKHNKADVTMDLQVAFDDVADTSKFVPYGRYEWENTAEASEDSFANETAFARRTVQTVSVVATSPEVEPEARVLRRQLLRALEENETEAELEDLLESVEPMEEDEPKEEKADKKAKEEKESKEDEKEAKEGGKEEKETKEDKKEKEPKEEKEEKEPKAEKAKKENEIKEKEATSIAFSFLGTAAHSAGNLYWDPQAGVGYEGESDTSSNALAMATSLSMLVALFVF